MPEFEVRHARTSDAHALATLLGQLGYPAAPHQVSERLSTVERSDGDTVLVAVRGGEVAGLASLTIAPMFAEGGAFARVTALVVDEAHRGHGVGLALMARVEEIAARGGCAVVQLTSGRRGERAAAHRFYPSIGYEDTSTRSILYEKRLPQD